MPWNEPIGVWLDHLHLISPRVLAALWVLAVAGVAGTALVVWRAREHRLAWSSATGALAGLFVLAAVADTVNAHYAYWPTAADARQALMGDRQWHSVESLDRMNAHAVQAAARHGLIVKINLPADRPDGFPATTNIAFLPPQYFAQPADRFPVVYFFHGTPGRPADLFHAGQAGREGRRLARLGHPAIIVAPQMSRSWTDDPECVDGAVEKVESHLLTRVIPAVDARLRTQADRAGRVLAGVSAGGYCALNLGLRHRDLASAIVDLSGDTRPTHSGGAAVLFGRHNPQADRLVAANSPDVYAAHLPPGPSTRVWLDSGTGDKAIVAQLSPLARQLRDRGLAVCWWVRPGGHTYYVWKSALRDALPWALGATSSPGGQGRPGP